MDRALSNLRMLAKTTKDNYIITDNDDNIVGHLEDSIYNTLMYKMRWIDTVKCLAKLYVTQITEAVDGLIMEEKSNQLEHMKKLLQKSRKGVNNLKHTYTSPEQIAYLDTIIENYIDDIIQDIQNTIQEDDDDTDEETEMPKVD